MALKKLNFKSSHLSLKVRLLAVVSICLVVCFSLVGFIVSFLISEQMKSYSQTVADSKAGFLAKSSASFILNYDVTALEAFAKESMIHEGCDFVLFLDNQKAPLNELAVNKEEFKGSQVIEKEVISGEEVVGYVEFGFNSKIAEKNVAQIQNMVIIIFIAAIIILDIILYFALGLNLRNLIRQIPNLRSLIQSSNSQASELNTVSGKVDKTAQSLNEISQQTSASMEQISSMLSRTELSADQGIQESSEVNGLTLSGLQQMTNLVNEIESLKQVSDQLKTMEVIISDIEDKTMVINDIVFKTQLLSFNASIEAARAGQHGRGFAVVAEEIGNLAQVSGSSATEIRTLLDHSKEKVNEIVSQTEKQVEQGKKVSEETLVSFQAIKSSVESIHSRINEIQSATREQSSGIKETVKVISELGNAALSQTKTTQEIAEISTNIQNQTGELEGVERSIVKIVLGIK